VAFRRDKALAAAEKYAAKGQHDKAAKEYQALVDDDPQDVRSWLLLADCLVRCGQRDKAIEKYLQVAKFYTQAKQAQKALAVYRQVLNLDGSRLDVHLRCGHLFRELGQTPDAVLVYEKVASAYLKTGRAQEAFELFAAVADLDPGNVAKRLRLAELYSREKMLDEAVEQFGRCADGLFEAGRVQEYIRVAERLLYHRPVDEVLHTLAGVYLKLNEPRRALMKLNTLLQKSPSSPDGLELLAETFVALGKKDKAISVMLELARGEKAGGPASQSNAIRVLQKALEWDPGNTEVSQALAALGGSAEAPAPVAAPKEEQEQEQEEEEIEEIEELDAEEIEELDADELEEFEEIEEDEVDLEVGVPSEVERSLTNEVMNEVSQDEVELDEEGDIDKVLHEVRVLTKYRLFEHALTYLDNAFEQDPKHVAALELRAELLTELDRGGEAAEVHVSIARLVESRDPGLAAKHVTMGLEVVPGHAGAQELAGSLGGETAKPQVEDSLEFDLGDELDTGPGVPESIEPEVDTGLLDDAFGTVEFDEDEDVDVAPVSEEVLLDASESSSAAGVPDGAVVDESGIILDEEVADELELDDGLVIPDSEPAALERIEADASDSGVSLSLADPGLAGDLGKDSDWEEEAAPTPVEPDESTGFTISVDAEIEAEKEPEPVEVEDRFGLDDDGEEELAEVEVEEVEVEEVEVEEVEVEEVEVEEVEVEEVEEVVEPEPEPQPEKDWPDVSDEIEEVEFFLGRGLQEDAEFAYDDLKSRHPDHPAVLSLAGKFGGAPAQEEAVEAVPEPVEDAPSGVAADIGSTLEEISAEEVESPAPSGAEAPLLDLEDEDDDDYLAAIFSEGPKEEKKVSHQARAQIQDADAGTHFDLGTAYREMGLVDDALKEFDAASEDPRWKAKALVMMAALRVHTGQTDEAIQNLEAAIEAARTADEKSEAYYELGIIYETLGDSAKAVEQFESVADGFRDKAEKLDSLRA
jgi:tetratricopeptide (TPR) repeat protein